MAKESGIGWTTLTVDESAAANSDIKNDVTNLDISIPRGSQDVTGLDSSANERLQLLADFAININGIFNDAANKSHIVFKTISSSSVTRTVSLAISGQSLNNETNFNDYILTRAATGEFTYSAPGQLNSTTVPTWS